MIKLKKLVEAINDAAEIANATLADSQDQVINNFFNREEESGKYTAKKVTIEYPISSSDGKINKLNVDVPLITVVPISSARIDEMRFTTLLDIAIEKDELMVSFSSNEPTSKIPGFNKNKKHATATLDLIIKPQENTEGLNKLIEGYEKMLRAQIPG